MKRLLSFCWLLSISCFLGCTNNNSTSSTGGSNGSIAGGTKEPPGDTGTQAQTLSENPLSSICQNLAGDLYVSSSGGKLLTSTDGTSFTVLDETKRNLSSAFCERQSTGTTAIWFAGTQGAILRYDGTDLSTETSGTTSNLNALFGTDIANIYAVGENGTVVHWDGISWSNQTSSTTQNLYGVSGQNSQSGVFIVGANKTVLKLTPPSSTWISVSNLPSDIPSDTRLNSIWVDPSSGEIFVVGNAGAILHGFPEGTSWEKQTSGTSLDLLFIHGSSKFQILAVGKESIILSYDGTTWTKQTSSLDSTFNLNGVFSNSATDAFAVGANGTSTDSTGVILRLTASGWSKIL